MFSGSGARMGPRRPSLLLAMSCMMSMGPVPVEISVTVGRSIAPETSQCDKYLISYIPEAEICRATGAHTISITNVCCVRPPPSPSDHVYGSSFRNARDYPQRSGPHSIPCSDAHHPSSFRPVGSCGSAEVPTWSTLDMYD